MKRLFIMVITCLLLMGCQFHPRRAAEIPPQLHTLYLKTSKPYDPLITQLRNMLTSLHIKLVKQPSQAAYTLNISNITFYQSNPPITTTSLAVNYTYSLSVTLAIQDRHQRRLMRRKMLNASHTVSQTASQVYTPGTATLVKHELQRDIISQIYYVLISNQLRNALNHHVHPSN